MNRDHVRVFRTEGGEERPLLILEFGHLGRGRPDKRIGTHRGDPSAELCRFPPPRLAADARGLRVHEGFLKRAHLSFQHRLPHLEVSETGLAAHLAKSRELLVQALFFLFDLLAEHLSRLLDRASIRGVGFAEVLVHDGIGDVRGDLRVVGGKSDLDPGRLRLTGDPEPRAKGRDRVNGRVPSLGSGQAPPFGLHPLHPGPDWSQGQFLLRGRVQRPHQPGGELRTSNQRSLPLEDGAEPRDFRGHPGQGIGGHGLRESDDRQPFVDRTQGVVVDGGAHQRGNETEGDEPSPPDDDHPLPAQAGDDVEAFFGQWRIIRAQ